MPEYKTLGYRKSTVAMRGYIGKCIGPMKCLSFARKNFPQAVWQDKGDAYKATACGNCASAKDAGDKCADARSEETEFNDARNEETEFDDARNEENRFVDIRDEEKMC